jgi:hypothetical protein
MQERTPESHLFSVVALLLLYLIKREAMRMYSRLMNVIDRILVDGFPVIVALGLTVILMALIANVLA